MSPTDDVLERASGLSCSICFAVLAALYLLVVGKVT